MSCCAERIDLSFHRQAELKLYGITCSTGLVKTVWIFLLSWCGVHSDMAPNGKAAVSGVARMDASKAAQLEEQIKKEQRYVQHQQ